jgi:hypothetical protein
LDKQFTSGGRGLGLRPRVRFHADGPDESRQFATDGGDDLWFVLARRSQFFITRVQAMLRFLGNLFDIVGQPLLAFEQKAAHPGPELIRPARQ